MSEDPTNSPAYDELQNVLESFVSSNTNNANTTNNTNNNNNKKEVGGSCVKEAEAAAAKAREQHEAAVAMLRQHKASGESTASNNNTTPATQTSSTPTIAIEDSETSTGKEGGGEDLLNAPMPQTQEEAMDQLNKLKTMRDELLTEQDRNNKFVSRYPEKVAKSERMATLHHLIPRELYIREDRYQQELEHVYKWSGISDSEIAEIYLAKLKKSGIKQHGASYMPNKDPYQNFRDVPNFLNPNPNNTTNNNGHAHRMSDVERSLRLFKRITGN